MPWLKTGDLAASHPLVLAVRRIRGTDERSTNEVYGFVTRCATQSAGHMTDYYVDYGTAEMFGLARTDILLKQARQTGDPLERSRWYSLLAKRAYDTAPIMILPAASNYVFYRDNINGISASTYSPMTATVGGVLWKDLSKN